MTLTQFVALFTFFNNHPVIRDHIDRDGDGYAQSIDCDDTEAAVHPGQQEVCDGWDNDCDGLINEADPDVIGGYWFVLDLDGDGYGFSDPRFDVYQCAAWAPTPAYVRFTATNEYDCDDTDANINPAAVDVAFDGIDQDCDGVNACEFEVEQADGSFVTMPNVMVLTYGQQGPHGASVPGWSETMRFTLTVGYPECPDVIWETGSPLFLWTDNAQTDWAPGDIQVFDLADRTTSLAGPYEADSVTGTEFVDITVGYSIQAGETKAFGIYADSTGASSVDDDQLRVDVNGNTMIWCSEDGSVCSDMSESGTVNGGVLFY